MTLKAITLASVVALVSTAAMAQTGGGAGGGAGGAGGSAGGSGASAGGAASGAGGAGAGVGTMPTLPATGQGTGANTTTGAVGTGMGNIGTGSATGTIPTPGPASGKNSTLGSTGLGSGMSPVSPDTGTTTLGRGGVGAGTINTAPGSDINPSLGTGVAPGSGTTGMDLSTTGSVSALGDLDINGDGQVTLSELRSATQGRSNRDRNGIVAGLTDLQRQQLRAECQSAGTTGGTQPLCQSLTSQ